MATCKDCIHERVCFALIKNGLPYLDNDKLPAEAFCMTFKDKADVQEVKHGQWIVKNTDDAACYVVCSNCGLETWYPIPDKSMLHNYCPDCGVMMDEEEVEE